MTNTALAAAPAAATTQEPGGIAPTAPANSDLKTATIDQAATEPAAPAAVAQPNGQTAGQSAGAENFRTRIVDAMNLQGAERDKELKRLERFASEADIYKSNRELEKKFSSGEVRARLADDATPEQIAEYRKQIGVPETPEGYDTNIEGVVFGDADKPIIGDFAKAMHAANADPAAVKAGLAWYANHMEQVLAQRAQADHDAEIEVKVELGKEWGQDAKLNFNLINNTLEQYPALKEALWQARGEHGQGRYVGYNKGVLQELARLSRELNPAATIIPGGNANMRGLQDEMAAIEKKMGTSSYTQADRERYTALVEIKEKQSARGG